MTDLTDDQVRALLTDEESVRVVAKEGKGCGPAMAVRLADALLQARADLRLQKSTITQMTMQWGEDAVRVEELIAELAQARADAAAAVALAYEAAAEFVGNEAPSFPDNVAWCVEDLAKAIRALAPDAGTAELAKLRSEMTEWKRLAIAGELTARNLSIVEAERDTLAASLAAQTALVATLTGAVTKQLSEARETFCYASPGSDEEFTSLLLGFDTAAGIIRDAIEAAVIASWPPEMQAEYRATVASRGVARRIAEDQIAARDAGEGK